METTPAPTALYNPLDPEVRRDPYPHYRELREHAPIHQGPLGRWVLTRYDDILAVQRDHRFGNEISTQPEFAAIRGGNDAPVVRTARRWMIFRDPPDHTRLRKLVNKVFTGRAVEAMRQRIQELVDDLLDAAAARGKIDVVVDFAYPLPVTVICDLLGLPPEDRAATQLWAEDIGLLLDPVQTPESVERSNRAMEAFLNYVERQIDERRRRPREDILTALIAAEEDGDRLDHDELLAMVSLLFGAGHDTTRNLIGNGVFALLRHPEQLAAVRANPGLLPNAVDEVLRYESPVQMHGRVATEAVKVGGTMIAAGDWLLCLLGAGNRDPQRYPDPDRFDVTREDIRPLSFGGGAHFCLGAHLARLEGEIALGTLVARFERMALLDPNPVWREHVALRGLASFPVTLS